MYGKLFVQMYDGTLGSRGPWEAMVAFQNLIILANRHGEVDMTIEALSKRTTIPREIFVTGIDALERPDPESRTPDCEGRRIVRLDEARAWGWRIVNYEHYRKIASEEDRREYQKNLMRVRRARTKNGVSDLLAGVSTVSTGSKQEAEVQEQHLSSPAKAADPCPDCPQLEIVALWHEVLPHFPAVATWGEQRKTALRARWRDRFVAGKYKTEAEGLAYWQRVFVAVGKCQ